MNELELMSHELGELLNENQNLLEFCLGMRIVDNFGTGWRLLDFFIKRNDSTILSNTPMWQSEWGDCESNPPNPFSVDTQDWATQGVLRGLLSLFKESQMIDVSEHSVLVSTIDPNEEYNSEEEDHVDSWHLFEYDNYGMALAAALIYAM